MKKIFVILFICTLLGAIRPFFASDNDLFLIHPSDFICEQFDEPIPSSLGEAFERLNTILEPEDIELIKNSEFDDLILFHMGLGMWIRNNWIFPEHSEMRRLLRGFAHLDDHSQFIIEAYHHYLNNVDYDTILNMLAVAMRREFLQRLFYALLAFLAIVVPIAAIRFFLRKTPNPTKFFERIVQPTQRLKFLRVPFVLCIIGMFHFWLSLMFDMWWWRLEYVYHLVPVAFLLIALPISALYCFGDMTKKQIAVSAALQTALFAVLILIFAAFFEFGNMYILFSRLHIFLGGQYADLPNHILLPWSMWPRLPLFSFIFFPFIYVPLARSKKTVTAS